MARINVESQLAKLRKAKEVIEKKEKELLSKTRGKAIARILQIAQESGITAAQITAAFSTGKAAKTKPVRKASTVASPRGKVAPKYRNPENPEQTWTGRGKSPLWVQSLKQAGKLESALIKG